MPNTPFMNLTLPVPTVTLGPLWASELDTALTLVDSHNHTPGFGVQIPTAALNINADLSLQGFNLTTARSLRMAIQGSALSLPTDLSCLYNVGGELFYNDGVGNQVQITIGGAIDVSSSGNISGMGATTASVAYTNGNKTFTFNQNTNQRALLDVGTVIIRDPGSASVNGISVKSPTSLASSYNLTLPTGLPAALTFLQINASGQLSSYVGNNVVVSQTNAATSLAIVRGIFHYTGSSIVIDGGEGFSASRVGVGVYTITYTTPFADLPVTTVNVQSLSTAQARFVCFDSVIPPSATQVTIITFDSSGTNTETTQPIHFHSIGQV